MDDYTRVVLTQLIDAFRIPNDVLAAADSSHVSSAVLAHYVYEMNWKRLISDWWIRKSLEKRVSMSPYKCGYRRKIHL